MKKYIFLLAAIFCVHTAKSQLQGILFSEYRMILDNNTISSLQLNNPTPVKRTYSLSFVEKQMNNRGELVDIPDSVSLPTSIKRYLRVFPRTIELAPGESQEVQIQLRVPPTVADGEYRTYLHFLPLEKSPADTLREKTPGVKFAIKFRIGAAIPLFYRRHTSLEGVDIDSVFLTKELRDTVLHFTVRRRGSQSTYGNIEIRGTSGGEPVVLRDVPGRALYAETDFVPMSFPISTAKLDRTAAGTTPLTITYYNGEERANPKSIVYAKKTVEVMLPK